MFKRYITTLLLVVMASMLLGRHSMASFAKDSSKPVVSIIVRAVPNSEVESRMDINSNEVVHAFKKGRYEDSAAASALTDMYIILRTNPERHFRLEASGTLWDEDRAKRFVLPGKGAEALQKYAMLLRGKHYGKMHSWKDAQHIFPRKSIFSITDMDTGLTFQVQRRAGSAHADVQPVTKQDTAIMKQIYDSGWSWKRKAIWVHSGNDWVAASMNGMPHGGDGIPDNDFSGHFCVHFLDSTTHRSDHPDLAHQLMIHKSAGELRSFMTSASPRIVAESFIEGLDHQDTEIIGLASEGLSKDKRDFALQEMKDLVSIQVHKEQPSQKRSIPHNETTPDALKAEVRLTVTMQKKGLQKQGRILGFSFSRDTPQSAWQMTDIRLNDNKKTETKTNKKGKSKKRAPR
ncbi:hypothetical protein [Paenibacillus sp. RC67]|uniref:hypothetical protein n=1 Tax=Paenibacillus sp. RC67 TaxID=3039392 RepID=UPI0024AE099E|nr:hypothetical protein [Paenibacillus sp. RC67]